MARGASEDTTKKGGLFEDLSVAQVIAGALAAVTSMLLASQIGIYGSVIGVAAGSIVSAVASQLYKKFLTSSAEKLRELKPGDVGFEAAEDDKADEADKTRDDVRLAGKTVRLAPMTVRRTRTPSINDAALQGDVTVQRARAIRNRKRSMQRRVVAVSVVSAVFAVLASAAVVDLTTQGQGMGAKTSPLVVTRVQPAPQAADVAGSASHDSQTGSSAGSATGESPVEQPKKETTADTPSGGSSSSKDDGKADAGVSGNGGGADSGASDASGGGSSGLASDLDSNSGSGDSGFGGSGSSGSSSGSGSGSADGSPASGGSSEAGSSGGSSGAAGAAKASGGSATAASAKNTTVA